MIVIEMQRVTIWLDHFDAIATMGFRATEHFVKVKLEFKLCFYKASKNQKSLIYGFVPLILMAVDHVY